MKWARQSNSRQVKRAWQIKPRQVKWARQIKRARQVKLAWQIKRARQVKWAWWIQRARHGPHGRHVRRIQHVRGLPGTGTDGAGTATMTRSRHTQASLTDVRSLEQQRLDGGELDAASRRAWTSAMTVRPFGDGYLVDCEDDTHYVRLAPSTCSCPESTGEGVCVHVRRVAIEINLGRVPPPSERTVPCENCDRPVAISAADDPPALCPECALEPGDVVVDAKTDGDTPLLVVSEPGPPARFASLPGERTVAEYPENEPYSPDTPVVEAVYPHSVTTDRDPRRYLFPLARLRPPDRERRPPERDDRRARDADLHALASERDHATDGDDGGTPSG